ncbi:sensor domain-containing diguanylate cyclase [Pseudoalteromonas sp. YIC-656]|uniref:sensor domain-containing diguanylate cyclase n=1 Tax=Pseudoalteromonas pernae TaxID=3118054 RepID=UPI003242C576
MTPATMPENEKLLEIIRIQSAIAKQGLEFADVMEQVVQQSLNLTSSDGAAIELAEDGDMVYRAASGIAKDFLGLRLDQQRSLSGLCVRTRQSQYCQDTETDERVDRNATRALGVRSMIVIPLFYDDVAVGVLKVMSHREHNYTDEDVEVLNLLRDVIASALYFAQQHSRSDLHYLATHDSLSGLPNRALFMDRFHKLHLNRLHDNELCAIFMVDMNGLKTMNDKHGHQFGDAAIVETAKRLLSATRATDTVARIGGDEFALIVAPLPDPHYINQVITRIKDKMGQPYSHQAQDFALSVSIGHAVYHDDASTIQDLMHIADQRMYSNKRAHYQMQ